MNITKEQIKETLKLVMNEEADYKVFFKKALKKAGKSIPSMSDDEKKAFFNKIDKAWDAKGEVKEGNAFGAAVTAAKKAGDDEFEVGGEKFKVEESHSDCNCGCGGCSTNLTEGKFKKDDLVYNKRTKTVGIVRLGDDKSGEVKTDADGNVDVDELEKYNPIKNKHQSNAKVAPSTEKEVSKRGLFNPFKNESVVNEASDFAGWIAIDHKGNKLEIKKSEAKDLYNAKLLAIKKLKVPKSKESMLAIKPAYNESVVNEASKEAMGIAALTGTRGSAVEDFINKHELNGKKLFKSITKANLRGRLNFASALSGKDGNPNQKLTIKLHKENFNEELSTELAFEVITFMERPLMETKIVDTFEVNDMVTMLVNEGINDVLTEGVKAEFGTLVKIYSKK
jgi:hypothetical protein|tara:strand:- start:561 stop:1745 length:1185 start_codon:yes stop_codon:yes gene_type:complete